jgi:hypothetical protein
MNSKVNSKVNSKTLIEMAHEAGWQYADGDDGYKPLWRFAELVRADEREECACLCDALERTKVYGAKECAEGIRVRGQA